MKKAILVLALLAILLRGGIMIPVSFAGTNVNDGTNYNAYFPLGAVEGLAKAPADMVKRSGLWPLVSGKNRGRGRSIPLVVEVLSGGSASGLKALFDTDEETPETLVVSDDDGGNQRYVYAVPVAVVPREARGTFAVTLQVHGDVFWRTVTGDSDVWYVTASGQTNVVNNGGDADAFPVITLEATSPNTQGFTYKQWVPIRWRLDGGATNYPVDLTDGGLDTAALVTAGKAQADGDDFRVQVAGAEVDRWFGNGFNQTDTKVWINLSFQADVPLTLKTAIAGSGDVDSIEVNESISAMPSSGILVIGTEAFTYGSKNDSTRSFHNVTRAAKDTSMAAHSAGASVYWIQHDVWYLYGDATVSAPAQDDDYEPAFDLDNSDNDTWDYNGVFGDDNGLRSGIWVSENLLASQVDFYNGNHGASADPWDEIGIFGEGDKNANGEQGRWKLYNPCGIVSADWSGESEAHETDPNWPWPFPQTLYWSQLFESVNGSTWTLVYTIPDPTANATWQSWTRTQSYSVGVKHINLHLTVQGGESAGYLEAHRVIVSLNASNTPTSAFSGSEQGNYVFLPVILNETTGESIALNANVDLNEEVEIDTDAKTVTYLKDGSNLFSSLSIVGGARKHWLPLQPGNNTLRYTDPNTGNVTVTIEWHERWR